MINGDLFFFSEIIQIIEKSLSNEKNLFVDNTSDKNHKRKKFDIMNNFDVDKTSKTSKHEKNYEMNIGK